MTTLNAKTLVVAAVAAVVMGIVGCGSDGKKADAPPAGTGEPAATPTADATATPAADATAAPTAAP